MLIEAFQKAQLGEQAGVGCVVEHELEREERKLAKQGHTIHFDLKEEQGRIIASLIRALGDFDLAEDVMQEAWLRAARALGAFRWESAFSSWLSGIALNRVRELARKKRRSLVQVDGDWEMAVGPSDAGRRIDLERALALLPPGFRTVLVLHDVEGFTHQEIGKRLGITDGTSKSQLHGARRAMRRIMGLGAETA